MMRRMSLRHALLGLLADHPASGWDLLKRFETSLAFVWPATQSQLYTELNRMTDDGLVVAADAGPRNRKEYAITDLGHAALEHWLLEVTPERVRRSDAMLRVFFLWSVEPAAARDFLVAEAAESDRQLDLLRQVDETVTWDDSGFDRCARLALEHGKRLAAMQADWARWAAAQIA